MNASLKVVCMVVTSMLLASCGTLNSIGAIGMMEYAGIRYVSDLRIFYETEKRYPYSADEANKVFFSVGSRYYKKGALEPLPWGRQVKIYEPCSYLGDATHPSPPNTFCGDGRTSSVPSRCDDFGAVLYDADKKAQHFVVYVVGYTSVRRDAIIPGLGNLIYRKTYIGPAIILRTYTERSKI